MSASAAAAMPFASMPASANCCSGVADPGIAGLQFGQHRTAALDPAQERGQRQAVGGGHADSWRASHAHGADRLCHLVVIRQRQPDLLVREARLVEQAQAAVRPDQRRE
jgi:hypothetical protein